MPRPAVYCSRCLRYLRKSAGPELAYDDYEREPIEWIAACDWCLQREAERRGEVERLGELWAARECAAPDCQVVFQPATSTQRFHDDRCRKRTHARAKAAARAGV